MVLSLVTALLLMSIFELLVLIVPSSISGCIHRHILNICGVYSISQLHKAGPSSTACTVLAIPLLSRGPLKKPDMLKSGPYIEARVEMAGLVAGSSSSCFDLPNTPLVPHQPTNFEFPKRAFGKMKVRSLLIVSTDVVYYNESIDIIYCHICITVFKKKMRSPHANSAFVSKIVDLL